MPYAEGKVDALLAAVGDRPLLAAFGDSAWDAEMLARAAVAGLVRPKEKLVAKVRERSDLAHAVELARE
jgi:phosphoserine phosphatase